MSITCAESLISHFDFTTPKGSLQAIKREKKKWGKDSNKRNINERREKKPDFPFNFYIDTFGEKNAQLGREFFKAVFRNPDIYKISFEWREGSRTVIRVRE